MPIEFAKLIPWLPALGAVLCGLCCARRSLRAWAAPICIGSILGSFVISVGISGRVGPAEAGGQPMSVHLFDWIRIGGFEAGFTYMLDPLTVVMLFVVTGIGALVAIYAAGYMAGDRGYARFFAGVCLFIFAMTTLVLADNLVLLYLGWEGVGLCSYLLIGFNYDRPSAVAAAKKAFIVNRVGDLGFAVGIFLTVLEFGTVQLSGSDGLLAMWDKLGHAEWRVQLIPFLLMLGAFGKSAQLPLHVWLPDAMEGPTPVSALIHAATMVTAGVYMIARLLPLFVLSPHALPCVAVVGAATALFAATIALCQHDIKRVFAYSTISQLGYMFLGVGVLSTAGGIFHLFTHAFFKALLFLTAGSVMHALAGQLDLRRMSGLRRKMPVTCWLMFTGCLALAGFPFTAGFFSKDTILTAVLEKGLGEHRMLFTVLAIVGLVTALITAFYTFRLWFRVFLGPTEFEMGSEHHGAEDEPDMSDHTPAGVQVEHVHEPHEVGWLMNGPLLVLAGGALLSGWLCQDWLKEMVSHSTASTHGMAEHGEGSLHTTMMFISAAIAIAGIGAASWFHWWNRPAADRFAEKYASLVRLLANKYYVDEFYDRVFVQPLYLLGQVCYTIDRLVLDGLVALVGLLPRAVGLTIQPTQRGSLQGYGLGMAVGATVILLVFLVAMG